MGPEIIVISGFRNNRGQKSADLVISELRNNSSSILSELGLFDVWILPRTKYSRWAYIVRVCDTAPYPHYIDLAHYMISGLYSAGIRTIRD